MTTKEISLRKALTASRCPELPRQLSKGETRFWVEAIILVRKRNVQESYAIAKRHGDGSFSITSDFGAMSPVAGVLSIHPYLYLDERFLYAKKSLEQKRAILIKAYPDKEEKLREMDETQLQMQLLEHGIKMQQESAKAKDLYDEMDEYIKEYHEDDSNHDIPVANRARKTANQVH